MGLPEKNTTEGKFLSHHLKLLMLTLIPRMLLSRLSTEEGVKGPRTFLARFYLSLSTPFPLLSPGSPSHKSFRFLESESKTSLTGPSAQRRNKMSRSSRALSLTKFPPHPSPHFSPGATEVTHLRGGGSGMRFGCLCFPRRRVLSQPRDHRDRRARSALAL